MSKPMLIEQANLSLAWADAFIAVRKARGHTISPLIASFTGLSCDEPTEDDNIRNAVDSALEGSGQQTVQTVANTIFPEILWRHAKGNREAFYESYLEALPDYVAMCSSKNNLGLYFGRLIAYGTDHKTGTRLPQYLGSTLLNNGNQIETIIQRCRKGVKRMKLQASVFDPTRDKFNEAMPKFPCLQHITFVPCFESSTLTMNAFYATQQLFIKGYGNFLGLARLAQFVAEESHLQVDRISICVGIEKMESGYGPAKKFLAPLTEACEWALEQAQVPRSEA